MRAFDGTPGGHAISSCGGGGTWATLGNKNNACGPTNIALGQNAGYTNQCSCTIAIGRCAGNTCQGSYAVAIGTYAGYNNQSSNTIIINATGEQLNGVACQTNSFYVKPVRQVTSCNPWSNPTNTLPTGFYSMAYNPVTNEIIYWS